MTKRYDFNDVAILIPIRIDSLDRLENITYVVNFLLKYCNINIYILHADIIQRRYLERLLPIECKYCFIEDKDPIFHRTMYINQLFNISSEPILSIWDADVIIPPEQLYYAIKNIRYKCCDVCFPYDGRFFNVDSNIKSVFFEEDFDIQVLKNQINKLKILYGNIQNGGVLFISRDAFIDSGCEDESFYGWGPEDWNRVEKWKVLNYRISRSKGPLFHLTHVRDINGNYSSMFQRRNCQRELTSTKYKTKKEFCGSCPSIDYDKSVVTINHSNGIWTHENFIGHYFDNGLSDALLKFIFKFKIKDVIDYGCGPGWYIADMRQEGINAHGIDGNPNLLKQASLFPDVSNNCMILDLSLPYTPMRKYDLLISIEVGEHIPPDREFTFIENICNATNKFMIISWASPLQKGDGHINCRDNQYIINQLEKRGFHLLIKETEEIRNSCDAWWLKQNILCLYKNK